MDEKCKGLSCVDCRTNPCGGRNAAKYPDFCLTLKAEEELSARALKLLGEDKDRAIAIAAAEVESEGYGKLTRIEEIMLFARKIGAKKLGIATCMGLIEEARTLAKILRINDFEVCSAACKVGAVPKTDIGIPEFCECTGKNMCNPILQALLLNEAKTDLNLVVGLCVGHDSLFMKHSDALCTTVVTKDRVLCHNPAAALYLTGSYYKRLLEKQEL
jgi:uncharacterized metal-binding protein